MNDDGYTRITLRIPNELHAKLTKVAARTSKSMNAEIVGRLENSFPSDSKHPELRSMLQEHLMLLRTKYEAKAGLRSMDSKKLPDNPADLVELIDQQKREVAAYLNERTRILRLFEEAERLLLEREEKEKRDLIG